MGEFVEKIISSKSENEPKPRRVFVEIGTNRNPVPVIGEKKFEEGDVYIGVDVSEERVRDAKGMAILEKSETGKEDRKKNLFFISADAKALPLQEKSVDELYFGNFFGDPAIVPDYFWEPTDKARKTVERFLDEASRVLGDKGKIIIKENNTPANLRFLQGILRSKGFAVKKFVKVEDKNWREEIAPYDKFSIMARNPHVDSYILEAEKKPDSN